MDGAIRVKISRVGRGFQDGAKARARASWIFSELSCGES